MICFAWTEESCFFASPSESSLDPKDLSPYRDTHQQPEARERRDHARAPVREERKRNPDDRHQAEGHADVEEDLPEELCTNSDCDCGSKAVLRLRRDVDRPDAEEAIEAEKHQASQEPPIFREYRKGEIGKLV